MSKADECRQLAADCLQLSRTVHAEDARAALVDMAQRWLRLADDAERVSSARTRVDAGPPRARAMQAQPMQQQQSKAVTEDEK